MAKIDVGTKVIVDLWNVEKHKGMVKNEGNTMDLIRAESEFHLEKGQRAIIVESYENFAKVIPFDEFSRLIVNKKFKIDIKALARNVYDILKVQMAKNGGISSVDELLAIYKTTSIKHVIDEDHFKNLASKKNKIFDVVSFEGTTYFAIKASENTADQKVILSLAKKHDYLTDNLLKSETGWSDLRLKRIMEYFTSKGYCRSDSSYLAGNRYFFIRK
ncbi:MAG: hypothetical protein ACFFCS_17560 [Candidatus Hodarchaeota archaeon]